MPLVVDASVMASWHFEDERNAWSTPILDLLKDSRDQAYVPGIWWFELHHVLLRGERRGRATPRQTLEFQNLISDLPVTIASNGSADNSSLSPAATPSPSTTPPISNSPSARPSPSLPSITLWCVRHPPRVWG